jgi:hypothetical protein
MIDLTGIGIWTSTYSPFFFFFFFLPFPSTFFFAVEETDQGGHWRDWGRRPGGGV